MIRLSGACLAWKQNIHFSNTSFGTGPATTGALEPPFLDELEGEIEDENIFRAELLTLKTFFYRSLGVQGLHLSLLDIHHCGAPYSNCEGIES